MNGAGRAGVAAGAAAAAAIGAAIFQGQYPTAQRFGATIHRERAAGRRLALTFDDGRIPSRRRGCSSCWRATTRRRPSS